MKKTACLLLLFAAMQCLAQNKKIITVAADGSGNYKTVQAAFDAIPNNNKSHVVVYVKDGIYKEKLHLDSGKNFVELQGQSKFNTILTWDDHTGKVSPKGEAINTVTSYSFRMSADDFFAHDITFRNDAGFSAGQAVAVEARGDRAYFLNCRFVGNQDILFLNSERSHQLYTDCYIEGTTDFIFGPATAWFQNCHIHSKKSSHITAASTPQQHPYGFVFNDCVITADTALRQVSLGRPWRPYSCVLYMHCYMPPQIKPEGWSNWNNTENYKTTRYTEYENYGPGANNNARVTWAGQLTATQAAQISPEAVLGSWVNSKPGMR